MPGTKKPVGRFGLWICVACGRTTRLPPVGLPQGWLNYRGGRVCRTCLERFEALPVGSYANLGAGCRLVKVSDSPPCPLRPDVPASRQGRSTGRERES